MPSTFSLGSSSAEEPLSLASLITGSNCLKTCGMEDIQYAARVGPDLLKKIYSNLPTYREPLNCSSLCDFVPLLSALFPSSTFYF
jgi:hypothetical protein